MKQKWIILGLAGMLVVGWLVVKNLQVERKVEYKDVAAGEFLELLKREKGAFLVDVHTPEQEHLAETDAVIPFNEVKNRLSEFPQDKATPILVYCRSGSMSAMAAKDLVAAGYRKVYNLTGGMHSWTGAGMALDWRDK